MSNTIADNPPKDTERFPWDNKRDVLLLSSVQTHGVHKAKGTRGVKELWEKVNATFFQNCKAELKKYNKPGSIRRLTKRFQSLLEDGKKYKDSGNLSRESGNLREKMTKIRDIIEDIELVSETKKQTAQDKAIISDKMNAVERATLGPAKEDLENRKKQRAEDVVSRKRRNNIEGHGTRKSIDGVVTKDDGTVVSAGASSGKTTITGKTSAEEMFMLYLYEDMKKDINKNEETKVEDDNHEDTTNKLMATYLKRYSVSEIVHNMDVTDSTKEKIVRINYDKSIDEHNYNKILSLVSIYCCKGEDFSMANFTSGAKNCDIGGFCVYNIFNYFQNVKETVHREELQRKNFELNNTTPLPVNSSTNAAVHPSTTVSSLSCSSDLPSSSVDISTNTHTLSYDDKDMDSEDIVDNDDDVSIPTTIGGDDSDDMLMGGFVCDDYENEDAIDTSNDGVSTNSEFLAIASATSIVTHAPVTATGVRVQAARAKVKLIQKQKQNWKDAVTSTLNSNEADSSDSDDESSLEDTDQATLQVSHATEPTRALLPVSHDSSAAVVNSTAPATANIVVANVTTEPPAPAPAEPSQDLLALLHNTTSTDVRGAAGGNKNKEEMMRKKTHQQKNRVLPPPPSVGGGQQEQLDYYHSSIAITSTSTTSSNSNTTTTTSTSSGRGVRGKRPRFVHDEEAGGNQTTYCGHGYSIKSRKCPDCSGASAFDQLT